MFASNATVLDDTVKFFKLQQERKNQFPSDRKDDETIKREIEENYGNVCEMVKDWIFEDIKKKQVVKKVEEFDLSLLDRLDNDVKFAIIEFLPTFTEWKDFKLEEGYRRGIGFPHKIERDFRFSHRVDTDLVTFHKMRVLCKRFNRLMMSKIMNVKQLFISSNMNPMQCEYMATLLRMQRIYKDNNGNFPTQSIFLYEDLKIIRPEVAIVRNPEINSEIPQKGNTTIEKQNHSTPLFFWR